MNKTVKTAVANLKNKAKFIKNIEKLSLGQTCSYKYIKEDGTTEILAKVTCDTIGQTPRKYTMRSKYFPSGKGYTSAKIIENVLTKTPSAETTMSLDKLTEFKKF